MTFHKSTLGRGETYTGDKTLGDYIARKVRQDAFDTVVNEQKKSFDQWLNHYQMNVKSCWYTPFTDEDMKACWKAAQENK